MNTRHIKKLLISLFAFLFVVTVYHADAVAQEEDGNNVVDIINASADHTILAQLLAEAQLVETLSMEGPYTVLAPTDDAFNKLGAGLTQLRENPQDLQSVLIQHLFQGEVKADDVTEAIGIEIENGDIEADNGLIHVIDQVIIQN